MGLPRNVNVGCATGVEALLPKTEGWLGSRGEVGVFVEVGRPASTFEQNELFMYVHVLKRK